MDPVASWKKLMKSLLGGRLGRDVDGWNWGLRGECYSRVGCILGEPLNQQWNNLVVAKGQICLEGIEELNEKMKWRLKSLPHLWPLKTIILFIGEAVIGFKKMVGGEETFWPKCWSWKKVKVKGIVKIKCRVRGHKDASCPFLPLVRSIDQVHLDHLLSNAFNKLPMVFFIFCPIIYKILREERFWERK